MFEIALRYSRDSVIDDIEQFPASNSDPYDHSDLHEMLDALHAFSSADFFLATNRLADPNQPINLSRRSIRKAREANLSTLHKLIYTLKRDMVVSIGIFLISKNRHTYT